MNHPYFCLILSLFFHMLRMLSLALNITGIYQKVNNALSAANLITKPAMTVQLILKVLSGMSVTSTEFIKGGGGQYTECQ